MARGERQSVIAKTFSPPTDRLSGAPKASCRSHPAAPTSQDAPPPGCVRTRPHVAGGRRRWL